MHSFQDGEKNNGINMKQKEDIFIKEIMESHNNNNTKKMKRK